MAVPTTLAKFSDIQTTFGGSNPISISEYYKGGANVPSNQATSATDGTAIPTSGLIRVGEFRGLSKTASGGLVSASGWRAYDTITFNTNGTMNFQNASNVTQTTNWYSPTTTNIGNSYWIKVTGTRGVTSGFLASDQMNTWIQLNSIRRWTITNPTDYDFLTCQFAATSGGTVLATQSFELDSW